MQIYLIGYIHCNKKNKKKKKKLETISNDLPKESHIRYIKYCNFAYFSVVEILGKDTISAQGN